MNRLCLAYWPVCLVLLAVPAGTAAGEKEQPAITVRVIHDGACSAVVGDAVYFPFVEPGVVNPDKDKANRIQRFKVVVDGKEVEKPEVRSTNLKGATPGGPGETSVFLRPAKAGTYKIAITPIYGVDKAAPTRHYLLSVSPGPRSKAVNGLSAWAELRDHDKTMEIVLCLHNMSDRPIHIFDWVGAYPLTVAWKGPDGKPRDSKHYGWLGEVKLIPPAKENIGRFFATVAPDEVLHLGPHGRSPKAGAGIHLHNAEPGDHRVTVGYVNAESGKQFELKGDPFWTGTLTAPEVVVAVK
jgi:hypothetical protein